LKSRSRYFQRRLNILQLLSLVLYALQNHTTNTLRRYDGWNHFQPPYDPPKFTGELPKFDGEGLKVYTGSCHCGAVTIAVKTKPFPEVEVKEDNCSICQRVVLRFLPSGPNIPPGQAFTPEFAPFILPTY
jgi:hypothetical protein